MDSYSKEIERVRSEIEAKRKKADTLVDQFVAAATKMLTEQAVDVAKNVGKSSPDISATLGPEGVNAILVKVEEFKSKAPDYCKEVLGKDSVWEHRRPTDCYSSGYQTIAIPKNLTRFSDLAMPVCDCTTMYGEIFHKAGFRTGKGESSSYYGRELRTIRHPRIASMFTWTPEMLALAASYYDLAQELRELRRKHSELERQKIQQQSDNLWDAV
jgi:hypothetical protein